jgi:3-keto-5-aminohexanoate cleavage enzyme
MIQMIPAGTLWGITHANRRDFSIIAAAVGMGASTVRIGFEDSSYLDANTVVDSNVPLVEKTVRLLQAMDKAPMNPAEARQHFNIFRR